jgi:hypothetical protein
MNSTQNGSKLIFAHQRSQNITPDILVKSFWVSTCLALILTLPPLAVFLSLVHGNYNDNILMGSILGFGLHFILFAFSGKISNALSSLLDYKY